MLSYHLNDFSYKVILENNLKKNIAKKWYKWCEGLMYQQVILCFVSDNYHKNRTIMH